MYVALLALALLAGSGPQSWAQTAPDTTVSGARAERGGTAYLTGWPEDLEKVLDDLGGNAPQLLPSIDTLALDYRYTAEPEAAGMAFKLSWQPGAVGVYQESIRAFDELPRDVQMASIELRADVVVDGETVAETAIAVDSMALRPAPNVYTFEVPGIDYADVFLDTSAEEARVYFERGFTLANLQIGRVGFTSEALVVAEDENDEEERDRPRVRRPRTAPSRPVSIFEPRIGIFITGRTGGYRGPRVGRVEPRGDQVGRSGETGDRSGTTRRGDTDESTGTDRAGDTRTDDPSTGRTPRDDQPTRSTGTRGNDDADSGSRGKRSGDNDKDDDEDEDSLVPAAAGAAVAVAAAGIIGGTVGYYGTTDTPLGLTAGYVEPDGGFMLQAAVNSRVLDDASGQRLTAKLTGFYGPNGFPIQPSIGLGAVAYTEGENTLLDPSVTFGAVVNGGEVLIFGGYDVVQQVGEFGFAINFRAFGGSGDKNPPVAER